MESGRKQLFWRVEGIETSPEDVPLNAMCRLGHKYPKGSRVLKDANDVYYCPICATKLLPDGERLRR